MSHENNKQKETFSSLAWLSRLACSFSTVAVMYLCVSSVTNTGLELFHLPTLMHNALFINNMYVTLLSSTCFEH